MGLWALNENWVLGEAMMPSTVAGSSTQPEASTYSYMMVFLARLQFGPLKAQYKALDHLVEVMKEGLQGRQVTDALREKYKNKPWLLEDVVSSYDNLNSTNDPHGTASLPRAQEKKKNAFCVR